ncbi:MAG: hypothetical protein D4R45_00675 [Planctomycetaceae bacterium]|nr:MAG: hypothetical protein D4R45_00675 [Planctomycetaceae bacterium]
MIRTAGRILKSNDVKLEGQFHLDAANAGSGSPKQQVVPLSAPQVRILENHPEYAVIEVTCSCGTKMSLKCEYAGAAAQAPDDPQT